MTMYFLTGSGVPTGTPHVGAAAWTWTAHNPQWQFRQDNSSWPPPLRRATPQEVAEALVQDRAIIEVLGLLASPLGHAVEQEVASLWLPAPDAALLADALTIAWRIIRDQNRPVWQRAEVLIAVAFGVAMLIAVAHLRQTS